jgi:hypothetical protein
MTNIDRREMRSVTANEPDGMIIGFRVDSCMLALVAMDSCSNAVPMDELPGRSCRGAVIEVSQLTEDMPLLVDDWLARFEQAIAARDRSALDSLFLGDSYWCDLLALTWRIETWARCDIFGETILDTATATGASGFRIDFERAPPRRVSRAGIEATEAISSFATREGRCSGGSPAVGCDGWRQAESLDVDDGPRRIERA